MIRFSLTSLHLPKFSYSEKEYEDAFSKGNLLDQVKDKCRFAVADGATESSYAREWAKLLVQSYGKKSFSNMLDFQVQVGQIGKRFQKKILSKSLSWFAEEKARMGAFSTFLGLELNYPIDSSNDAGKWSAISVGDSCLFQIRNDSLFFKFPMNDSSEFSNTPDLLSSISIKNKKIWENGLQVNEGYWQIGDYFIMATDAFAVWFLRACEQDYKPWQEIISHFYNLKRPKKQFKKWVEEKRYSDTALFKLKNDDTTCLIIKVLRD
jgi:hypothetical protein